MPNNTKQSNTVTQSHLPGVRHHLLQSLSSWHRKIGAVSFSVINTN